jgi:hypothetical protein
MLLVGDAKKCCATITVMLKRIEKISMRTVRVFQLAGRTPRREELAAWASGASPQAK